MIYMDYKVDHIEILLVFATTDPTAMVPSSLLSSRSPSLLLTSYLTSPRNLRISKVSRTLYWKAKPNLTSALHQKYKQK